MGVEKLILSLKKFQVFFWQSSSFASKVSLLRRILTWMDFDWKCKDFDEKMSIFPEQQH